MIKITKIKVKGFKSLKNISLSLQDANVLIGINGSGKSNILKLFEFLAMIRRGSLKYYVQKHGGASQFTFMGSKITRSIYIEVTFDNSYTYDIHLEVTTRDQFQIIQEQIEVNSTIYPLTQYETETQYPNSKLDQLSIEDPLALKILKVLGNITVYHFSDTSYTSEMKSGSPEQDNIFLKENGSNLSSILYMLKKTKPKTYQLIEKRLRLFVPFFDSFELRVDPISDKRIVFLEWRHSYNQQIFSPHDLSDGTIRAIAILTAIYQNYKDQTFICIDEPELGLHPKAITIISETILSRRKDMQILVATQSPKFIDNYDLEKIIVLEYDDGQSLIKDLDIHDLKSWLEDYTTGQLWEKNLIGGRP